MGGFGAKSFARYLTGYCALLVSAGFLVHNRTDLLIVVTSVYFIIACVTDTHKARIPNFLNLTLALCGIGMNTFIHGWSGAADSLTGLALGLLLLLIPYLMGGFGAGDVKALGALGAVTGPLAILNIFIYMAFFGGAMAVLHYLCQGNLTEKIRQFSLRLRLIALTGEASCMTPDNRETLRFPYVAAIAFGYYAYLSRGALL